MAKLVEQDHRERILGGVERQRNGYGLASRGWTAIDGTRAARAEWTGSGDGLRLKGVMYCMVVGTQVVMFHTQTLREGPGEYMQAAIQAFESADILDTAAAVK